MSRATIVAVALLGWLVVMPAFSADISSSVSDKTTETPETQHSLPPRISTTGVAPHAELNVNGSDLPLRLSTDNLIRLTTLLTAVDRFKQISLGDYEKALLIFATEDAVLKFRAFNKSVWVETTPKMGWSYFMSSSVHAVGNPRGNSPLIAFYNPWSDIFLITQWRLDADIPRLIDAEMLMGDWLRSGKELSPIPHWLRTDTFKPAALGDSVAQSIQIFETLFLSTVNASWRKELPVLENRELLTEVNYPAVALMLLKNLQNISDFRTLEKGTDPRMAACRRMALDVIQAGSKGHLGEIRQQAKETSTETWNVLASLNTEWFKTLEAVAVLNGKDGCLVFLSSVFDASGSLSLYFQGQKGDLRLRRIDVIDYAGFYQSLKGKGKAETPRKEISL